MHATRLARAAVLAASAIVVSSGCRTLSHPPERVWPAETPGAYPGRTETTQHGSWWFPSEIGPGVVPREGGNKGTLFYLGRSEPLAPQPAPPVSTEPAPPAEMTTGDLGQRVVRVVYNRVFEDRDVEVERLIFPSILFTEGRAGLDDEAQRQVRQAVAAIERARGYNVVIEGHTDAGEAGVGLDQRRADAVKSALVEHGIDASRLSTATFDGEALLSHEDTPTGHALNRRVAFQMIPANLDLHPTGPADDPMPQVPTGVTVETVEKTVHVPVPHLVFIDRLVFPNILFDYDKSDLRSEAVLRSDRAAGAVLALDHVTRLTVEGHCDHIGSHEYNDPLSDRRANAVRDRLIADGVPAEMVDAVGYGKRRPIANNDTPDGRQLNRRVEFRIEYAR